MKNLRDIVRSHIEAETLKEYLAGDYDTTSINEKHKLLELISDTVTRQVDMILKAFVQDIQEGSPDKSSRRKLKVLFAILAIIASTGLAFAVNDNNMLFTTIFAMSILVVQIYPIFAE